MDADAQIKVLLDSMAPITLEEMKELASILTKELPHARVDFYEVNGHVFFGEITFFHHGGWTKFEPSKWDEIFGNWLILPKRKNNTNTIMS